jgi:ribosomal protein S18 acetylase RimI-like enzyme
MIELKTLTSRQDKRLYLKYVNKFRKDYFTDAEPQSMQDVNYALELKTLCLLILLNNKVVGMVEATPGSIKNKKILNIATIYIDKQHRNKGIANFVYHYLDNLLPHVDIALHIEESNYYNNISKFKEMGFTHYWVGFLSSPDHRMYDEKTFVLYTEKYDNELMPIEKVA